MSKLDDLRNGNYENFILKTLGKKIEYPPMKNYLLMIKSHCDAPDFEAEIEAINKEDAINKFYLMLREEVDKEYIRESIGEIDY